MATTKPTYPPGIVGVHALPADHHEGPWDSIVTPPGLKERLLGTALLLLRHGRSLSQLNGAPLVERKAELNQDGELQYTAVDWALVAAAVVGVGYIAYEVFDNDESPSPQEEEPEVPEVNTNTPLTDLLGVLTAIPRLASMSRDFH